MSETVHELDYQGKVPLVGALLRRPFLAVRAHITRELHAAGFTDLQPAHLAVFQHPGPEGRSPGQIAGSAQSSKQAMNNLLGQLEQAGYLHRVANPDNRRERRIRLTERGHLAMTQIRDSVTALESQWRTDLGPGAYDQLRDLLARLNRHLSAAD